MYIQYNLLVVILVFLIFYNLLLHQTLIDKIVYNILQQIFLLYQFQISVAYKTNYLSKDKNIYKNNFLDYHLKLQVF